jgi:integrase
MAEDVPILKLRDRENERKPFTKEQFQAILEKSEGELHGIVLFGYYTGLRLSDICLLNWERVDTANQELNVQTAKTGRRQILPIAKPLNDWLLKRASTVSHWFGEVLAELGLREEVSHKKTGKGRSSKRKTNEYSFHSLRHSLTTHLKEAGVSEAIAMEIVGHDTAAMSRHYTKVDQATLREAISKL